MGGRLLASTLPRRQPLRATRHRVRSWRDVLLIVPLVVPLPLWAAFGPEGDDTPRPAPVATPAAPTTAPSLPTSAAPPPVPLAAPVGPRSTGDMTAVVMIDQSASDAHQRSERVPLGRSGLGC